MYLYGGPNFEVSEDLDACAATTPERPSAKWAAYTKLSVLKKLENIAQMPYACQA